MQNFTITFIYPWLLLLLLPAIGLTIFTHFTTMKKYRNTRNKIISNVLHTIALVLAILVLSGMQFKYQIRNDDNELLILVDLSETQRNARILDPESEEYDPQYFLRDDFVDSVISEAGYNHIKVGVIGFGLDQYYIAPMSFDVFDMYQQYERVVELLSENLASEDEVDMDITATDIKAALNFAASQFEHPETAKILLVTDGWETDESASSALQRMISLGIRVDVVSFDGSYVDDGVQVTGVELPDYYFKAHDDFTVTVKVRSDVSQSNVRLQLYDNGALCVNSAVQGEGEDANCDRYVDLLAGENSFEFTTHFEDDGLHELKFTVTPSTPGSDEKNNEYYRFINLEIHDKVLVIEQRAGDSELLMPILENANYQATKVNITDDFTEMPKTIRDIRNYDQIILNNISNEDLVNLGSNLGIDFIDLMREYVYDCGGGLLTFGGDDDGKLHAYNPEDMAATVYQEMLPVQITPYRPPLGTIFIADVSGSMNNYFSAVKEAVADCVREAVHETDYVGIMTLSDTYTNILDLTPATDKSKIFAALDKIAAGGATNFKPAVRNAILQLNNNESIANKHIVIFSDGEFFDKDLEEFSRGYKSENYDITLTMVLLGSPSSTKISEMETLTNIWGGQTYTYNSSQDDTYLMSILHKDLTSETISGIREENFSPLVGDRTSPIFRGVRYDMIQGNVDVLLKGYYGAKARVSDYILVAGKYQSPIYAQWKYGNGNVGSFMTDIYGKYSKDFLEDEDGVKLLENIVSNVMPIENIRYSDVTIALNSNDTENYNYYNSLNVYHTALENGETIVGRVEYVDNFGDKQKITVSLNDLLGREERNDDCYVITPLSADNNYTRAEFYMKKGCAFTVIVEKLDADGNVIDSVQTYGSFAFSKEYDTFTDRDPLTMLANLADRSDGQVLNAGEPAMAMDGFVKAFDRGYDPRMLFLIIAMVCFLLDIAVRKFKFKWIHEIVRERKMVKENKK